MPRGGKRTTSKKKECVCVNCGTHFIFENIGRLPKYCSSKCSEEHKLQRRGVKLICEQCGNEFLSVRPNALFCSKECFGKSKVKEIHHRNKHVRVCVFCGKEYKTLTPSQLCCSPECAAKYRGEKARKYLVCQHCGKTFQRNLDGHYRKYCSRKCLEDARRVSAEKRLEEKKTPKTPRIYARICQECGTSFTTIFPNQNFCSHECGHLANLRQGREDWARKFVPHEFYCKGCGEKVITVCGEPRTAFCSDSCMNKYCKRQRSEQLRLNYRAPVSFERLYKRDKGICQICGMPVAYDKSPEKTWSATIDHIVPLSLGGTHEPDNCQLAHRLCNSLKLQGSDKYAIDWQVKNEVDGGRWSAALDEYRAYMQEADGVLVRIRE